MSLFIGNISKTVTSSELEKLFGEYGSSRINYKGSYAFAEFDHEKDAEEALDNLQSKDIEGRKINIEWSKKSRKFDESKSNRRRRSVSRDRGRNDGRCYNCGRKGHYLRDCKSSRRHSRSRSRSRSRRRRSTSRDRERDRRHGHRSSRRRSHSRSSRSHSNRKRARKNSSRSSSSSASKRRSASSRDKSPYEKKRRPEEEKKERNHNHKSEEIKKEEKRISRSSSRRSDRSPKEKKSPKSEPYLEPNINQISDQDIITDIYKNGLTEDNNNPKEGDMKIDENNIRQIENIDSTIEKEKGVNVEIQNNTSKNIDYSKLKNDDLKNELKKRGISYSKNAKKNEMIDLLNK